MTAAGTGPAPPRHVLLFSGHRLDAPMRLTPRFSAAQVRSAQQRLAEVLVSLDAGPADLALSQAAAGGDILFLEACRARGVACRVMLPFDEAAFVEASILPSSGGALWQQRWLALKAGLAESPQVMPEGWTPAVAGADAFERCNHWMLATALAFGLARLRVICLWNGADSDGPGGTGHMVAEAARHTDHIHWIDTRTLR